MVFCGMNYFLSFIKEHKFAYILITSVIAIVLIVNNALQFAERVINNRFLLILSILGFYFLVWFAIKKETTKRK